MRTIKSFIYIALAVILLASCSKGSDYASVIPANATFVASADVASIAKKGDLANSTVLSLLQDYTSVMFSHSATKQFKEYMQAPEKIGIDFREPIYIFQTANHCAGITMKMSDKSSFDGFMKLLHNQNLADKPKETDDMMTGIFLDDIQYCYDDNTILLLASLDGGPTAAKQTVAQLFKMDDEESFVKTEQFEKHFSSGKDVMIYSNIGAFPLDLKSALGIQKSEDIMMYSSLDFQNGKVALNTELLGCSEKAKAMLKEADDNLRTIKGEQSAKELTKDMLLWGNFGVNGEWLLNKLKKNSDVKQSLFMIERAIDIEAMIRDIDGDVTFCLPTSVLNNKKPIPDFDLLAQLKTASFLDDVKDWEESQREFGVKMHKISPKDYLIDFEGNYLSFGVSESKCLDLKTCTTFIADDYETTFKAYEQSLKQSKIFMLLDLKALGLKDLVAMPKELGLGNKLDLFKALVIKANSIYNWEIDLELTDKEQNFLKALI